MFLQNFLKLGLKVAVKIVTKNYPPFTVMYGVRIEKKISLNFLFSAVQNIIFQCTLHHGCTGTCRVLPIMNTYTRWAQKCPNLFLSELRQISTKFNNFCQTDRQDVSIM